MSPELTDEVVDELARAYSGQMAASQVLASIGLDRSKQPSWNATTPLDFWREVASRLGLGAVPDGAAKLLDKALEDWPVNPVFQRARKEVTAGMASSSDAAGGQQVTGRGMPSPRTSESSTSHAGDATPDMIPEASAGPANRNRSERKADTAHFGFRTVRHRLASRMSISIVAALALTAPAAWLIDEGLGERAVSMPKSPQTAPRSPDFAPSTVPSEEALKAAILSATDFPGWQGTENPFSVDSLQLCGHAAKVKSATNTAGRLFIEGSQIYGGISVQSGAAGFATDRDAINFMSEVQSGAHSCVSWPKKDVTLQIERVERARFGEESIRVATTTQSDGIPIEIQFVYIRRKSTIALLYYIASGGYLAKPELDESSVDHFADILDSRIRTIN